MWWGGEWPRAAGSSGCVANFCETRDWTAGGGGFDLSPLLADCRNSAEAGAGAPYPRLPPALLHWQMGGGGLLAAGLPRPKLELAVQVTFPDAREVHDFLPRQASQGTAYRHSFPMPGHVVHVAAQIAALRDLPLHEVLRANRRNIAEVYGIDTSS